METAVAAAQQHASFSVTSLSHRLAKQFTAAAHGDPAGNVAFSPLSIYSALSLVAAGAQGKTLRELLDLLGARSREDLDVNVRGMVEQAMPSGRGWQERRLGVSYACGLWHDSSWFLKRPAYRDVTARPFGSIVRGVNFLTTTYNAVTQINDWVSMSTNGRIYSIVDARSVDSSTRLVVANAIRFKGIWKTPFDKLWTEEGQFHRLDGSVVDAKFMYSSKRQFIGVHDGFKVLRMPYDVSAPGGMPPRYSMCVLLPDTRDGLQGLMDAVASSPSFLQDNLPLDRVEVGEFWVPRFKISFETRMKEALRDLGVQTVFSSAAELRDLLDEDDDSDEPLILGNVVHKAVIEVDERGEAAAATASVGFAGVPSHRPPPVDFVADHPFAFFVLEEVSGAILFAGHVLDPAHYVY